MPRAFAAQKYVENLAGDSEFFREVNVFIAGLVNDPVFTEHVTLNREASVVDHLGQLLGDNRSVFFVIDRAPSGALLFSLGSERLDRPKG